MKKFCDFIICVLAAVFGFYFIINYQEVIDFQLVPIIILIVILIIILVLYQFSEMKEREKAKKEARIKK